MSVWTIRKCSDHGLVWKGHFLTPSVRPAVRKEKIRPTAVRQGIVLLEVKVSEGVRLPRKKV